MLKFDTFAFIYSNRPIYSSKRLFYMHRSNKKLITKLKIVVYVVMLQNKLMLWSYFPGFATLEFINQYHLLPLRTTFYHFSHQLQNWTSKTSLCLGVKEGSKITYQPYPGICIICNSVTAVFYHLTLKIQSLVRGVHLHSLEV